MKYRTSRTVDGPMWLPVVIGVIFMFISISLIKSDIDTKNSMDAQIQSTYVTHLKETRTIREDGRRKTRTTYRHVYHYTVDNTSYSCKANSSNGFKSMTNRTVYYKSNNPQNCFVDEGPMILFFKSLFFIFGLSAIIAYCRKK